MTVNATPSQNPVHTRDETPISRRLCWRRALDLSAPPRLRQVAQLRRRPRRHKRPRQLR